MIASKTAKPKTGPVIAGNIPDKIKALDRWVVWKYVLRGNKWDKPPLQTDGRLASSIDPQTWCSFAEAMLAYETGNFDGIGFVLGEHNGIRFVGMDLDDHVVDGQLDEDARFAVEVLQSYTEISPSGNGIKTLAIGNKIEGRKVDEENGYEFYDGGRYFTITGHIIEDSPNEINERADEIEYVHNAFFPPSMNGEARAFGGDDRALAVSAVRALDKKRANGYSPWLATGQALHSVADDLLSEWIEFSKKYPEKFVEGECEKKWNTFSRNRGPENSITIGSLIHWARQDGWVSPKKTYMRTDLGNAERMADHYRNVILYCAPFKKWFIWDGSRWREDRKNEITQIAKRVVRSMYTEAAKIEDEDKRKALATFAAKSESVSRIDAMIKLCRSEVPVLPEQFDQHPMLLNCPNGTIDLKTGELRPHRREDFITKLCPTNYNRMAETYEWDRFLKQVHIHDDLIRWSQRFYGYCLTGDVREHVLPIYHGVGANGKSTEIEAFMHAVGSDYAMKAPPDLLMAKRNDSHPTERADLFGKRFVACVESGAERRLNEPLIKELTGGDSIRARRMHEDFWQFKPTHKVILCSNHKPSVKGTDNAIWRRLRLNPFTEVFSEAQQDKTLPEKLQACAEGILSSAVEGCLDWQKNGLGTAAAMNDATKKYRLSQDVVGRFIAERCVVHAQFKVKSKQIFQEFQHWCEENGETGISRKGFGQQIEESGFERFSNNGVWYKGIEMEFIGTEGTEP